MQLFKKRPNPFDEFDEGAAMTMEELVARVLELEHELAVERAKRSWEGWTITTTNPNTNCYPSTGTGVYYATSGNWVIPQGSTIPDGVSFG